jgi:hypothetical protein
MKLMQNQEIENIINRMSNNQNLKFDFQSNKKKKNMTNFKERLNKTRKSKIATYDLNGYLIRTYENLSLVRNDGYDPISVGKCLNGDQKTHNDCIFIRLEKSQTPTSRIDSTEYKINKNSTKYKNLQILKSISQSKTEENNKPETENFRTVNTKNSLTRVGMFDKKGVLLEVFLTQESINKHFGKQSNRTIYRYMYGSFSERRLKKGFRNKFYFRKLEKKTKYFIGKQYDLSSFPQAKQTRFKIIKKELQKINNIPNENNSIILNNPIKEESQNINIVSNQNEQNSIQNKEYKSFWSRMKWLFFGK